MNFFFGWIFCDGAAQCCKIQKKGYILEKQYSLLRLNLKLKFLEMFLNGAPALILEGTLISMKKKTSLKLLILAIKVLSNRQSCNF